MVRPGFLGFSDRQCLGGPYNRPSLPMLQNPWVRALVILLTILAGAAVAALVWTVGSYFADIIVVFFTAWLLSFILGPTVEWLTRRRLPRWLAVIVAYLGVVVFIALVGLIFIPVLIQQATVFSQAVPSYAAPVNQFLLDTQVWLDEQGIPVRLQDIVNPGEISIQAQGLVTAAASNALTFFQGAAGLLFNVVLILILSVYMLLDGRRLTENVVGLLPLNWRVDARHFLDSVDHTFGGFIRGLFVQGLLYGIGTALIMLIAGLDFVAPVATFAGMSMIVPVIGPFVAIVPPVIIALFAGELWKILVTVLGLLVIQQIVVNVIGPKVVGDALGLHPMVVLAALLIGIRVAGLYGALVAIPIAAVVFAMGISIYRRQREAAGEGLYTGQRGSGESR